MRAVQPYARAHSAAGAPAWVLLKPAAAHGQDRKLGGHEDPVTTTSASTANPAIADRFWSDLRSRDQVALDYVGDARRAGPTDPPGHGPRFETRLGAARALQVCALTRCSLDETSSATAYRVPADVANVVKR